MAWTRRSTSSCEPEPISGGSMTITLSFITLSIRTPAAHDAMQSWRSLRVRGSGPRISGVFLIPATGTLSNPIFSCTWVRRPSSVISQREPAKSRSTRNGQPTDRPRTILASRSPQIRLAGFFLQFSQRVTIPACRRRTIACTPKLGQKFVFLISPAHFGEQRNRFIQPDIRV